VPPQYHPLFDGNFGRFVVKDEATGEVNATLFETSLERIFRKSKAAMRWAFYRPIFFPRWFRTIRWSR